MLQGIGIIALAVFAYLALSGRPFFYQRLRNAFSWIPIRITRRCIQHFPLFGIDFYRSFEGLFDRGDGLLTLTVITHIFYLILLSADREFFNRLIKTVAVVAGAVTSAVLQWITTGLGGKAWFLPPVSGGASEAPSGNAAFLAWIPRHGFFVILFAYRRCDWQSGVAILKPERPLSMDRDTLARRATITELLSSPVLPLSRMPRRVEESSSARSTGLMR